MYMNVYDNLNTMIDYIEDNLDKEIDYKKLAEIVGLNESILQRIFPIICNLSINEYIRKRRLTLAGKDLIQNNMKIIDVAVKYGYESPTSFSRAFSNFHGIKPGQVKDNIGNLKYYPKLHFDTPNTFDAIDYEIVEYDEMVLYGIGIKTNHECINKDAPNLFIKIANEYSNLPHPDFGMVVYQNRFSSDEYEYWVLWKEKYDFFTKKIIPKSKYLKFLINSQNAKDIQEASKYFYLHFLPTCSYQLSEEAELEYYHDGVTAFLIPIN